MTDAEGLTTTYTYDALGRVIAETKSGGGVRPDTTTTTTYDPEDRVLSCTVTSGDLSETETYAYDALGRTVATTDTAGIETRSTIRAFGTDCAVTNTTISYADGRTKKTALAPEKRLQMKKSTTKKKVLKINFRRVLLGFFENWDKSPQKKWDKGVYCICFTIGCGMW